METNDTLLKKLKYLGLDLENIPDSIKNYKPLEFRPSKFIDEHTYKVYRYVDVKDIYILLTNTNRLTNISEKYRKS